MNISPIIEIDELLKIYTNDEVLIFDVSNSPNANINFENRHLKGACFVDLNTQLADIKEDAAAGGRHPLPDVDNFAKTLIELGIDEDSHVILYDDKNGGNAAARFWWMLKAAGHQKVQVLNGGLNHAIKNNFPMDSGKGHVKKAKDNNRIEKWQLPVVDISTIDQIHHDMTYLIIDVRDKDRYLGIYEPFDLIAGHIPGAINIPFSENIDEEGLFHSPQYLRDFYLKKLGDRSPEKIVVHCGSGVTACHTLLSMAYAGLEIPNLYVGSWSEWSRNGREIG